MTKDTKSENVKLYFQLDREVEDLEFSENPLTVEQAARLGELERQIVALMETLTIEESDYITNLVCDMADAPDEVREAIKLLCNANCNRVLN